MTGVKVEALLALRGNGHSLVGRERIDLLEAVAECGSITKAAKTVGLSYKAAWDALNAVNNLLPRPVLIGRTGGRQGGGATVTEEGQRLIRSFRQIEESLNRFSSTLPEADPILSHLFWSVAMKTSARNAFRCTVVDIRRAPVNVEVILRLSDSNQLTAIVTNQSANDLELDIGREAIALVKSSFVMLARADELPRVSARNRLSGVVIERHDGGVNSEITMDIGEGKTLTAVITRDSADSLPLTVNDHACALFKASHVILAVD